MMFWRILRRLLLAHRVRLTLVLVALGAGAAVTAALLNLEADAGQRLTREFRAFGANVVIAPRDSGDSPDAAKTMDASLFDRVPAHNGKDPVATAEFLYAIADAVSYGSEKGQEDDRKSVSVVVVGYGYRGDTIAEIIPYTVVEKKDVANLDVPTCELGRSVAGQLGVHPGERLALRFGTNQYSCVVSEIRSYGGPEDNQVFLPALSIAQRLTGLFGRVSLIEASVPGAPQSIDRYIAALAKAIPEADVHGIRQFTEAEARLYTKIRGLLLATVALILVLTGLCVLAAMTGVAMERERDVGTMKALGSPFSRVLHLFLTEAALLGVLGGALGGAVGIALSVWLGKAVFGVAAQPRLIVYPVAVSLTVLVAIGGAFPLRRLAGVRPGEILRGVS